MHIWFSQMKEMVTVMVAIRPHRRVLPVVNRVDYIDRQACTILRLCPQQKCPIP